MEEALPMVDHVLSFNKSPGQLDALKRQLDVFTAASSLRERFGNDVTREITSSYTLGRRMAADNPRIKKAVPSIIIPYELSRRDKMVVQDLITRNLSQLGKDLDTMKGEILRRLTDGIKEGQGITEIAKGIRNKVDGMSKARSEMIARTETAYSYVNATAEAYKQAGVDAWQWVSALGYTCCDICQEKHGQVYQWGDPQPPEHPNCLCTMWPVFNKEAA